MFSPPSPLFSVFIYPSLLFPKEENKAKYATMIRNIMINTTGFNTT